jgi:hypothetical protein
VEVPEKMKEFEKKEAERLEQERIRMVDEEKYKAMHLEHLKELEKEDKDCIEDYEDD